MRPELTEYEVVWSGGPLLPEYDSRTTLGEMVREGKTRSLRDPYLPGTRCPRLCNPHRKYDIALQQAVRACRQDGMRLRELAERFEMPLSSINNIVRR